MSPMFLFWELGAGFLESINVPAERFQEMCKQVRSRKSPNDPQGETGYHATVLKLPFGTLAFLPPRAVK